MNNKIDKITKLVMQELNNLIQNASDGEKWITIKPHGEDSEDYRRLKLEKGETPKQAIERVYKKDEDKREADKKEEKETLPKKEETKVLKDYKEEIQNLNHARTEFSKVEKLYSDELNKSEYYKVLQQKKLERIKSPVNWFEVDKLKAKAEQIKKEIEAKTGFENISKQYNQQLDKTLDKKLSYIEDSYNNMDKNLKNISDKYDKIIDNIKNDISKDFINKTDQYEELQKQYDELGAKYNSLPYGTERAEVGRKQAEVRDKKEKLKKEMKDYYMENALVVKKHLQTKNAIDKIEVETKTDIQKEHGQNIQKALSGVIPSFQYSNKPMKIEIINGRGRENQSYSTIRLKKDTDIGTAIHETMHNIEEDNPVMLANSLAFAKYRTGNEKSVSLKKLTGINYTGEYAKADKFFNPYCGKVYGIMKDYDTATASEIMSMGIQELFTNPLVFAKKDKEYFNFVIANLRGEI